MVVLCLVYMCICVCLPLRILITIHVEGTSSTFLYMTLAINKVDRCGLSNTAHHACKEDNVNVILATEGGTLTT